MVLAKRGIVAGEGGIPPRFGGVIGGLLPRPIGIVGDLYFLTAWGVSES